MKKYIIYFIAFIFLSCNNLDIKKNTVINEYPISISDKKLEPHYNKTKWMLYCLNCDKQCILSEIVPIKDTTYFGFLDLKFSDIEYLHDTIGIRMGFYYNDTIKCDINTVYHLSHFKTRAFFKKSPDSLIYFRDDSNGFVFINYENSRDREVNPLQPDVINFIKNNKEKLNPWFRGEARRRKVID
jgi:hypothetical protein